MQNRLITAIFLLFAPFYAYAGAWLEPQGQGQVIMQASYFTSDEYFDHRGDTIAEPRYNKYELSPYLEYGLLENLTIGGTASLQHDTQSNHDNDGLADPEFFFRTALWKDDVQILSIQPLVKFASAFAQDGAPRGGSESTDAELSLSYGRNLDLFGPHDYLDLRAGYRYRSGDLHDQVQADAVLGLEIAPHWQLIPAVRSIISTDMKSAPFSENGDQDYTLAKLELGLAYQMNERQSVGITLFDHIDGRQTGNGAGVTLSFAQHF
jgi:hypothetical protein